MKIQQLLKEGYTALKEVNIETYMLDTKFLLSKVLNKDLLFLLTNRDYEVNKIEEENFSALIAERKTKKPIKYILGECEFMGVKLFIKEGVLIPRPDTEILVEEAIKEVKNKGYKNIADVCTGSGAIGASVAAFINNIHVKCYDISEVALEVAEKNVNLLKLSDRVEVIKSDLLQRPINNGERFDMIVSNPPYIKEDVIESLMEDVRNFEPHLALNGGIDGLSFYRRIVKQSKKILNSCGMIIFEIGYDQGEEVSLLLEEADYCHIEIIKDLAGNDRVVKGTLKY